MVGVEGHHRVFQQAPRLQGVHQRPDEGVRLLGVGHGVDIVSVGARGLGLRLVGVGQVDGVVVAVGAVAGVGDDKGEEGGVVGHLVKGGHEIAVHGVVLHAHVAAAVVGLIPQVQVDLLPVVHLPLAAVEGLRRVPLLPEEMGQGIGEVVAGVDAGGGAGRAGQEAGVDNELGVEGARGDVGGGVVVGKHQALLLHRLQIRHIVHHPGVDGLQLDEDQVLPRQDAGHGVALVAPAGGEVLHLLPLRLRQAPAPGEQGQLHVPEGVVVEP